MHSKGQHKQYIESTFNSDAPSIFKKANLNLYKAKEMEFLLVNCCVTSSYTGAVVILKNYGYSYMIYFVLLYRSERNGVFREQNASGTPGRFRITPQNSLIPAKKKASIHIRRTPDAKAVTIHFPKGNEVDLRDKTEQKIFTYCLYYCIADRDCLSVPGFECRCHSSLHHRHFSGADSVNHLYRVVFCLGFFCPTSHCIQKCPQAADGGGWITRPVDADPDGKILFCCRSQCQPYAVVSLLHPHALCAGSCHSHFCVYWET